MPGKPIDIQSGHYYWVQLDDIRLRLLTVELDRDNPGWWQCIAPLGTSIMAHEANFECRADRLPG
jgi:hypothetical protein